MSAKRDAAGFNIPDGRMLNVADVAGVFAVSEDTVRKWARSGGLAPDCRPGRAMFWHPESIRRAVSSKLLK